MSFNGWVKVHRKILDHWVSQEPELFAFWMRLLIEANHCDTKRMFNGTLIEIKRGQTLFGLEAFEAKSGISRKKLRRYLSMLESESMIGRQKTNKYSLISIVNYEEYQLEGRQEAGKGQAEGKPRASQGQHLENVNTVENEKTKDKGAPALDYSSWPGMPSDQILKDWRQVRKTQRAAITQTVINRFGKELHIAEENGLTVDECLTECIVKGWRGFKAHWVKQQQPSGVRKAEFDHINGGWKQ